MADILADCDFTDLCPLFEQELLFLGQAEGHGFGFDFAWHRQECNTMRLVMESFINESVLYRGLMEERMAVEWRILRQRMVTLVMEHLEAGPCLVEVLRYTHDDPENRRKRLEYVVLINEVPQWCPDTNSTVDVHVLERRIYEYGSSSSSQVYWRRTPPVYFPDPPTAPQEPTDDWI